MVVNFEMGLGATPSKKKAALQKTSENWKESMANLVGKLTLKDASKNAYSTGEAVVGREELEKANQRIVEQSQRIESDSLEIERLQHLKLEGKIYYSFNCFKS